mmetsp:Transcript_7613/g.20799  ORF Transcript_7613/g.20799 Transcript_7613/m.20799 type:complete len:254 (-) Transcript_7613:1814-2575(-)
MPSAGRCRGDSTGERGEGGVAKAGCGWCGGGARGAAPPSEALARGAAAPMACGEGGECERSALGTAAADVAVDAPSVTTAGRGFANAEGGGRHGGTAGRDSTEVPSEVSESECAMAAAASDARCAGDCGTEWPAAGVAVPEEGRLVPMSGPGRRCSQRASCSAAPSAYSTARSRAEGRRPSRMASCAISARLRSWATPSCRSMVPRCRDSRLSSGKEEAMRSMAASACESRPAMYALVSSSSGSRACGQPAHS